MEETQEGLKLFISRLYEAAVKVELIVNEEKIRIYDFEKRKCTILSVHKNRSL